METIQDAIDYASQHGYSIEFIEDNRKVALGNPSEELPEIEANA